MHSWSRRSFILAMGSAISPLSHPLGGASASDDWQHASLANAGFEGDVIEQLDEAVRSGKLRNLHAVVVARAGRLVFDRYYEGYDQRWGERLGTIKFGPSIKHDLRSISKNVVGLLYGIAMSQRKVPMLDQPLLDQFPRYEDLSADPMRRRMTVAHALSMTLGTEWNESLPYMNPANSEYAMELATDRYRFVLDRPMVAEPGSRWIYNGGATAILAHLIARGTGVSILDYAREKLLEPLGVSDAEWVRGSDGDPAAASGLRMRPLDLAKLGQLVVNGGRWGDQQLVPVEWLEESFKPVADTGNGIWYGYHWWLGGDNQPWLAGFGNGGQRLHIIPSLDLVVVVMAGNYNTPDDWKVPTAELTDIVMPAAGK